VNVSIPDSLDVLKLAVFLGDRYVLQSFGRENNRFAQSVLAHLKDANFKEVDFDQLKKAMAKLVNSISGDHFASINWNGKYVSFRQAGGDYLNNPQMIENTVGRFIRAMVIASNPAAYRDEYIKKLTAMAPQPQGQANQVDTRITARTTGIWIAEIDAVIIDGLRPGDNIVKILKKIARKRHRNEGNKIMVIPNSAQAKSALLGAKGLRATTLEQLRNLPADKFFHVIIAGKNIPQTASETMLAFGIYDSDNNKIAIGVDERRLLKPGDPNFVKALKILTTGTSL
jgi:hypothetical protein